MHEADISYGITADGFLFSCPVQVIFSNVNGQLTFAGTIQWGARSISDIVKGMESDLSERSKAILDTMLPDCFPEKLYAFYENNVLLVDLREQGAALKLARSGSNTAVLFVLESKEIAGIRQGSSFVDEIQKLLDDLLEFLGIEKLAVYVQTKGNPLLPYMVDKGSWVDSIPEAAMSGDLLMYSDIVFEGDSLLCKGVRQLFGLQKAGMYIAMAGKSVVTRVNLPAIDTGYVRSSNLVIQIETGAQQQFLLKGTFVLPCLEQAVFVVDCGISQNAFRIEAAAEAEKGEAFDLFGAVKLGNTCLVLQFGTKSRFGLYSSVYIRSLSFSGAIMLEESAGRIYPVLVSAAVSELSIPALVENLAALHMKETEVLDFIQIYGLPFQEMPDFPAEAIVNKDVAAIVSQFNRYVNDKSLNLDPAQVQLTGFDNGVDLTDLKRMRHYYISGEGKLKLEAQFYYAAEKITFGEYQIEQGIFVCGVVDIFGKRFEVLFSMMEAEGLLAYAKIPAIDLGFISIDASEKEKKSLLQIPADSPLAQFVDPGREGMVFYLSACKAEVSFYFDGSVVILGMFRFDARVLYIDGSVSIDVHFPLCGIFRVSLHLQVEYSDFMSGNFEFSFMLDTAGLTEKLTAVTDKIDKAVRDLRNQIDNARIEIDKARENVEALYSQIETLNQKIDGCKRDISSAKWWKRVFVSIAKGAEIAAYETAKAALYASVGVAKAALEVAEAALKLTGEISESVLDAANAVIQGAMSLFYINYIRLDANAGYSEQYFNTEIDFVALGKNYHLRKAIARNSLATEDGLTGALSGSINSEIPDNLAADTCRSSRGGLYRSYSVEQNKANLGQAEQQLETSVNFIKKMQCIYMDNMNMPIEECNVMNTSLRYAVHDVESMLRAGVQAGNMSVLESAMGDLSAANNLSAVKDLISAYDSARALYDKMHGSITKMQCFQRELMDHNDMMMAQKHAEKGQLPTEEQMRNVLYQVEWEMYQAFPVTRSMPDDFINLSKESCIQRSFREAEEQLGSYSDSELRAKRKKSQQGNYKGRLD